MKIRYLARRVGRYCAFALVFPLLLPNAFARIVRNDSWARDRFAAAERLREALNARAPLQRTRHDYQRAIDAYRRVYFGCPTCGKADPSAAAAADLLVDMGRHFDDDSILRSAIKQYQFLRREYPGSGRRVDAAFAIAEIYKDDLDQPSAARAAFQDFLKRYPRSHLSEDAKDALVEIEQDAAQASARKSFESKNISPAVKDSDSARELPADSPSDYQRVKAVRYFSLQDYTRVAIELERSVHFESQRIHHPDRFFFDLRDTRLVSGLAGKTIDVDDKLLKKIRVAQFQRGRTRVVLEVDPSADFNAFLQPDPARLIIDIRGKQLAKAPSATSPKEPPDTNKPRHSLGIGAIPINVPTPSSSAKIEEPYLDSSKQALPATPSIPKRIVEADDDDDDEDISSRPSAKSVAKHAVASEVKTSSAGHGKRKSADGNNDEVATLNPSDTRHETKPLVNAVRISPEESKNALRKRTTSKAFSSDLYMREAQPTISGDRSLIRALGLKIGRIVIDPGHGGHDTGTIGPNGLEEKDLVLEVGKRLAKLLQTRLGADVVFTRNDDTFIPLETRTSIANQELADLFVSIHANSSRDPDARGVETYYLNFTSSADALEVAARENAVSDKSIHELQDLVKKIALKEKIEESREFATDVQRSLHSGLAARNPGNRDRGVKKAPFIVLIGANMPSILAEISFVSNPGDARKLETAEYRQRIADSLYRGIAKYVSGLSGVKVASRLSKADGQ